jgi:hypothetical protein
LADDHVLNFLDVVGLYFFERFPVSADRAPNEHAFYAPDGDVALARRKKIVLDGLQALTQSELCLDRGH